MKTVRETICNICSTDMCGGTEEERKDCPFIDQGIAELRELLVPSEKELMILFEKSFKDDTIKAIRKLMLDKFEGGADENHNPNT